MHHTLTFGKETGFQYELHYEFTSTVHFPQKSLLFSTENDIIYSFMIQHISPAVTGNSTLTAAAWSLIEMAYKRFQLCQVV